MLNTKEVMEALQVKPLEKGKSPNSKPIPKHLSDTVMEPHLLPYEDGIYVKIKPRSPKIPSRNANTLNHQISSVVKGDYPTSESNSLFSIKKPNTLTAHNKESPARSSRRVSRIPTMEGRRRPDVRKLHSSIEDKNNKLIAILHQVSQRLEKMHEKYQVNSSIPEEGGDKWTHEGISKNCSLLYCNSQFDEKSVCDKGESKEQSKTMQQLPGATKMQKEMVSSASKFVGKSTHLLFINKGDFVTDESSTCLLPSQCDKQVYRKHGPKPKTTKPKTDASQPKNAPNPDLLMSVFQDKYEMLFEDARTKLPQPRIDTGKKNDFVDAMGKFDHDATNITATLRSSLFF